MNKDIAESLKTAPKTVSLWRTRFAERRFGGHRKRLAARRTAARSASANRHARSIARKPPEKPARRDALEHANIGQGVGHVVRDGAAGLEGQRTSTASDQDVQAQQRSAFCGEVARRGGVVSRSARTRLGALRGRKDLDPSVGPDATGLPIHPGRLGTMTADYKRNGTTTLFAAIDMAEGKLIGTCMAKHRHQEWIKFLRASTRKRRPDLDLHFIVDNYATHKHPQGEVVAETASSVPHAFHSDEQFVAEPDRALVSRNHAEAIASRHVPQRLPIDQAAIIEFVDHHTRPAPCTAGPPKPTKSSPKSNVPETSFIKPQQRESLH